MDNYRRFVDWQVRHRGLVRSASSPAATTSRLLRKPAAYPQFEVRNLYATATLDRRGQRNTKPGTADP